MTPALIGLLGVIAGGLLSGGVQWAVARSDRRLAGRTAARLLFTHLSNARDAMRTAVEEGWDPNGSWAYFDTAWVEHRRDLARVLNTKDFLAVSSTFAGIENLAQIRAEDLERAPPSRRTPLSVQGHKQLMVYAPYVQRALLIIHSSSFTKYERVCGEQEIGIGSIDDHPVIQR